MSMNKRVLVHCKTANGKLTSIATELLDAGHRLDSELGQELSTVLIRSDIGGLGHEAIAYGNNKVYIVDDPSLQDYAIEPYLIVMEQIIQQANPAIILLGQTLSGRDLTPWLAFRLNTGVTMDCMVLEINPATKRVLMTRPTYGGNAQAVQVCRTDPQIATVTIKAMAPSIKDDTLKCQAINVEVAIDSASFKTKVAERKIKATAGINLENARVIVAGGRGIGSTSDFQQLEEIAGLLNGAVGATRPACDAKWVSDSQHIGITGKIVSPDLIYRGSLIWSQSACERLCQFKSHCSH